MNGIFPSSSARGLQHNLFWVSHSHGVIQIPTNNAFGADFTSKEEIVGEMGTPYGVLNTQFYDKSTFNLDVTSVDDSSFVQYLMDAPASSSQASVLAPHLTYQASGTLFGVQYHMQTQKPFMGFVLAQCLGTVSVKQAREGNEMVSIKGSATQAYKTFVTGNQSPTSIAYTRCVSSAPPFSRGDDSLFTGSTATLSQSAVPWPMPGTSGDTQTWLLVLKNGVPVTDGFTISGTTLTLVTAPATTDVWEVFTPYIPS